MSYSTFSVCIPRIFANIPDKKIIHTFEYLNLGKVDKMDIVYKIGVDGSEYKMAFIHFSRWYCNSAAENLRRRIEDPNLEARLAYDDPWYWIVLPNNSKTRKNTSYKFTLDDCYNRISNIETEISSVYEELFKREFIPNETIKNIETFGDIETGDDMSDMLYDDYDDDTPLHMPPRTPSSISTNHDDDETYYDVELGGPEDSYSILIAEEKSSYKNNSTESLKRWMTQNICGNA
jgi:hypothetical protein